MHVWPHSSKCCNRTKAYVLFPSVASAASAVEVLVLLGALQSLHPGAASLLTLFHFKTHHKRLHTKNEYGQSLALSHSKLDNRQTTWKTCQFANAI